MKIGKKRSKNHVFPQKTALKTANHANQLLTALTNTPI
jgi:hypothetical protein